MRVLFLLWALTFPAMAAAITEFSLELGVEDIYFHQAATEGTDYHNQWSVFLEPEVYTEWNDGLDSFTVALFGRKDQRDDNRTHADIREALWIHAAPTWEVQLGVGKVFWGVTESLHLVDVINQTDFVDNINLEEKLGQPMAKLSLVQDWGVLDFYLLPYFRDRTFPGENARLRSPVVVDTDNIVYESSKGQEHVDTAIRWSQYYGDWEWALSYFSGTNRDPRLIPNSMLDPYGSFDDWITLPGGSEPVPTKFMGDFVPEFIQVYDQIEQYGVELQYFYGGWVFKGEARERMGVCWENRVLNPTTTNPTINYCNDPFTRADVGFEYTQTAVFETFADIGWIMEYLWDSRGVDSPEPYENDLMLGSRLTLNDEANSSLLVAVIYDRENYEQSYNIEASRRLGDSMTLSLAGTRFPHVARPTAFQMVTTPLGTFSKLSPFAGEDFIRMDLVYFF